MCIYTYIYIYIFVLAWNAHCGCVKVDIEFDVDVDSVANSYHTDLGQVDPADKRSGPDPSRVVLVFWPSCRLDSVLAMRPLLPLLAEEG